MANIWMALYIALLFFVLTPGVLLRLPGSKYCAVNAATHAVVFTAVYWLTHRMVERATRSLEGFTEHVQMCPKDKKMVDGKCQ